MEVPDFYRLMCRIVLIYVVFSRDFCDNDIYETRKYIAEYGDSVRVTLSFFVCIA